MLQCGDFFYEVRASHTDAWISQRQEQRGGEEGKGIFSLFQSFFFSFTHMRPLSHSLPLHSMTQEGEGLEEDEVEMYQRLLSRPLCELPGGGLRGGSIVAVKDETQCFNLELIITHKVGDVSHACRVSWGAHKRLMRGSVALLLYVHNVWEGE